MAKTFDLLRSQLADSEIQIGNGVIINQYPKKMWIAENLLSIPVNML